MPSQKKSVKFHFWHMWHRFVAHFIDNTSKRLVPRIDKLKLLAIQLLRDVYLFIYFHETVPLKCLYFFVKKTCSTLKLEISLFTFYVRVSVRQDGNSTFQFKFGKNMIWYRRLFFLVSKPHLKQIKLSTGNMTRTQTTAFSDWNSKIIRKSKLEVYMSCKIMSYFNIMKRYTHLILII